MNMVRPIRQLRGTRGERSKSARVEVAQIGVGRGLQEQVRIGEAMVQLRGVVVWVRMSNSGEQCRAAQQSHGAQE